jgi:hypothetical protein
MIPGVCRRAPPPSSRCRRGLPHRPLQQLRSLQHQKQLTQQLLLPPQSLQQLQQPWSPRLLRLRAVCATALYWLRRACGAEQPALLAGGDGGGGAGPAATGEPGGGRGEL